MCVSLWGKATSVLLSAPVPSLPLLRLHGPSFPLSVPNSTGFLSVSRYLKTLLGVSGLFTSEESLGLCPHTSQPRARMWLKPNRRLLTAGHGPWPRALRAPPGAQARDAWTGLTSPFLGPPAYSLSYREPGAAWDGRPEAVPGTVAGLSSGSDAGAGGRPAGLAAARRAGGASSGRTVRLNWVKAAKH